MKKVFFFLSGPKQTNVKTDQKKRPRKAQARLTRLRRLFIIMAARLLLLATGAAIAAAAVFGLGEGKKGGATLKLSGACRHLQI